MQRSGIDTIKYHTWPRIPMGKWQTHSRHHKREPRGQPFPSRWPQSTYKQTRTKHSKHKTEQKHKRSTEYFWKYYGKWIICSIGANFNRPQKALLWSKDQCFWSEFLHVNQKFQDVILKNIWPNVYKAFWNFRSIFHPTNNVNPYRVNKILQQRTGSNFVTPL